MLYLAVCWLLRRDLIVQLYHYVYVMLPMDSTTGDSKILVPEGSSATQIVDAQDVKLSDNEKKYLSTISPNEDAFTKFVRLCPHLRADPALHTEEILQCEFANAFSHVPH